MKLQFNLNKEEAEAFKRFSQIFSPLMAARNGITADRYHEEQFTKDVFLNGFNHLNAEFQEYMNKSILDNKEQFEKEGLVVVEDEETGMVSLSGTEEALERLDSVEVPGVESTDEAD